MYALTRTHTDAHPHARERVYTHANARAWVYTHTQVCAGPAFELNGDAERSKTYVPCVHASGTVRVAYKVHRRKHAMRRCFALHVTRTGVACARHARAPCGVQQCDGRRARAQCSARHAACAVQRHHVAWRCNVQLCAGPSVLRRRGCRGAPGGGGPLKNDYPKSNCPWSSSPLGA